MAVDISFTRFAHADTNILSMVVKDLKLWRPLQDFLHSNDLCLGISNAQVAELSDAKTLHESLNVLLTAVPSATIKNADVVLAEEVSSHPNRPSVSLFAYPLNALLGTSSFGEFLASSDLAEARQQQRLAAQEWMDKVGSLKSNFPPSKSSKYVAAQADSFVWNLVVQELGSSHAEFLRLFKDDVRKLHIPVFRSVRIMGYVIFYKYYVSDQKLNPSDFGDMFQLYDLPYCKLAVMERNIGEFLIQIKRNHDVLDGVTIMNKDLLKDWEWLEE